MTEMLPKEVYYVFGFLILSNIKGIFSFIRTIVKKEVEHEFNTAQISQVQITLGQILEKLGKMQSDITFAHENIRAQGVKIDNFKHASE